MRQLLLILISLVFFVSSCDFFKNKKMLSNDEDTLLIQKRQDSLKFVDSIRELKTELKRVRKSHKQLLDSIKSTQAKVDRGNKYHIIVGSFRNSEYLNSYNTYIQDKGFKTSILENQYGFKMISVESFKTWRKAETALENIQNDVEENAWIYIRG